MLTDINNMQAWICQQQFRLIESKQSRIDDHEFEVKRMKKRSLAPPTAPPVQGN